MNQPTFMSGGHNQQVDRGLRWYRSTRCHRIGKAPRDARDQLRQPEHVAATATSDARLVWIGKDDRGIELEIVALDPGDAVVVVHVMPTELQR